MKTKKPNYYTNAKATATATAKWKSNFSKWAKMVNTHKLNGSTIY